MREGALPGCGCAPEGCRGRSDKAPRSRTPGRVGPAGWSASYGEAAPIVWLSRESSHPFLGVPRPFVSERGVMCVLCSPHEDNCPEYAMYSKQTGQKIGAFLTKPTAQYFSDNRSDCSVSNRAFHITKNKMCTCNIDIVCVFKFSVFIF